MRLAVAVRMRDLSCFRELRRYCELLSSKRVSLICCELQQHAKCGPCRLVSLTMFETQYFGNTTYSDTSPAVILHSVGVTVCEFVVTMARCGLIICAVDDAAAVVFPSSIAVHLAVSNRLVVGSKRRQLWESSTRVPDWRSIEIWRG